jgi:outer membrane receptor protein involved in Fe transport
LNRKNFRVLTACIILFSSTFYQAQDLGTLRGFVTDSLSSEALVYATAFVKEVNRGANTDVRGYFLIPSLPANRNLTLIISYVGYQTKSFTIRLAKDKVTHYNIPLETRGIQLKTIEQVGERIKNIDGSKLSVSRISAKELEAMPKGVETDVFRSVQYLPGVQSTGDISAQYYVRGGASNQNLVLVDGITIYNPFHAMGLFGVVDPDMVNNIEFYKGGFSAEYGERISSVMSIVTKDGNKNNFGAIASASLMTSKLLLEGPIPHGSFIFTGRKSYSNQILKKFLNEQTVPIDFSDFSFKLNYSDDDFIKGAKFLVNGFYSSDNIANADPKIEDYNWKNNVFGFRWFQVGDSPLFLELGLSASSFEGSLEPKFSTASAMNNSVKDLGIQMNFTYMFDNKDEIAVGYHINQVETNLSIQNAVNSISEINSTGANISLYAKYKFMQWETLDFDFGTRINVATLSANKEMEKFEPRVNIAWHMFPGFTIKGAWGIFQQSMTTVTDENSVINIFEPWVIIPAYIQTPRARHYSAGVEIDPFSILNLSVEGYYKTVDHLPLLNENRIFVTDPDFVEGSSESYGLEGYFRLSPEPFNFTCSYTYAFAYKMLNNLRYYPRYDNRHKVNLGLDIKLGKGWTTSVQWIYTSGLPFTQIQGYYDKYYLQNIFTPWNALDPRMPFLILGVQNFARLPDYHRLDFTVSKKLDLDFMKMNLDFSIINVYDRKNIFYFKRDTGERVNMLPFLPTATVKIEL